MWEHRGQKRPDFAIAPAPGQESVWDYPRPPALEPSTRLVEVVWGDIVIARSKNTLRVLETASPPTFYIPPGDVNLDLLERIPGRSFCEWKGEASYWSLRSAEGVPEAIGWSYPRPDPTFSRIQDHLSFYPGRLECRVDGERVDPQDGGFYGGWVTREIIGPWKGAPGTGHW